MPIDHMAGVVLRSRSPPCGRSGGPCSGPVARQTEQSLVGVYVSPTPDDRRLETRRSSMAHVTAPAGRSRES